MCNPVEYLNGKKILIWGFGREGKSTKNFLDTFCPDAKYDVYEGDREGVKEEEYDYIFVSPGVPFEESDPKFTSQTQVFLEAFGNRTIGITGTKGKSTTSSLLYAALKAASGRKVCLVGNIQLPCLDYYGEMMNDEQELAVFELSCHQCQRLTVAPHIAVFLNLFEDHLDRYHTVEKYFEAKKGITRNQKADDVFYVGAEVPDFAVNTRRIVIDDKAIDEHFDLMIPGEHNQYNAEFVKRIACGEYGCDEGKVREAMKSFSGLPHRLEYVGEFNGIRFYDDSISTIPEATISAVSSIANVRTVLVGGMDRGIDYDILIDFIPQHTDINFICSYESGRRVYDAVGNSGNIFYKEDLDAAVALAKQITPEGGSCVLSPAAASYGYFKNFEERGDYFKGLVRN